MSEQEIIDLIASDARFYKGWYYIYFNGKVLKAETPKDLRKEIEKEATAEGAPGPR